MFLHIEFILHKVLHSKPQDLLLEEWSSVVSYYQITTNTSHFYSNGMRKKLTVVYTLMFAHPNATFA